MYRTPQRLCPLVLNQKVKPMEHLKEKMWGIAPAIAGGMGKFYLLQASNPSFPIMLIKAGLTAFICGAVGAFGKHLFDYIKEKVTAK